MTPEELCAAARHSMADGSEADVLPSLERAAKFHNDPTLYQWIGLLYRSLGDLERAIPAFEAARRLAPDDALIALSEARVALEAGLDARVLFARAITSQPSADALLGRAAARFAMGEGEAALAELEAILAANPQWAEGHFHWAQLASMTGQADRATATVERALAREPLSAPLWLAKIDILDRASRHDMAAATASDAMARIGRPELFALKHASALSDSGQIKEAKTAFAVLGPAADVHHAVHLARLAVRDGDLGKLLALTDQWMAGETAHHFWPYASIAWRLAGDPRWQWLEGDERLVRIIDISEHLGSISSLADHLRLLHARSGRFLDQSVRGGTQTDGALLSRISPQIKTLRSAITSAVEEYRAQLPPFDANHPMLRHRRGGDVRFAGSWSVRLSQSGHHSNHIHPEGWISSALYIALPDEMPDQQGWLTLGEPQSELGLSFPPIKSIQPRVGQLILFPSMMWHGTRPFDQGERMTVAFDVRPPL